MSSRSRTEVAYWDAIASRYYDEVVSPFAEGVRFPLRADVRKTLRAWRKGSAIDRKVAVDFGCGIGAGLLTFAGQVGLAVGLDFSDAMLDESERSLAKAGIHYVRFRNGRGLQKTRSRITRLRSGQLAAPDTVLVNGDFRRLEPLTGNVDLGLAVNSISPSHDDDVQPIFDQICACMRRRGTLLVVLPSLDTIHYLSRLSRHSGTKLPGLGKIQEGMYRDGSGCQQKYYTEKEVCDLFSRQRIKIVRFEKLRYPWSYMKSGGWGYFPGHERVWDWYVHARIV